MVEVTYSSNLDTVPQDTVVGTDPEGNKITIADLKNNIGTYKNPKPNCVIVWDDAIQFTTLGAALLYCIDQECEKPFDIKTYFEREIADPVEFLCTSIPGLTKEIIDDYIQNDYVSILTHSPKSQLFKLIFTWAVVYEDIHFVFKQRFDYSQLLNDLRNIIFEGENRNITFHFLNEVSLDTVLDATEADIVVTRNLKEAFVHMTMTKQKRFMMYIGPIEHNGLDIEFMQAYLLSANENPSGREEGPLGSQFRFFEETIDGV
jgi:hypothetical protein